MSEFLNELKEQLESSKHIQDVFSYLSEVQQNKLQPNLNSLIYAIEKFQNAIDVIDVIPRRVKIKDKIFTFSNSEQGMEIKTGGELIAIHLGFELGDNIDDNYLEEIATEFFMNIT